MKVNKFLAPLIMMIPLASGGCSNSIYKLTTPEIKLNNSLLTWEEVDRANGYSVYINERKLNVYSNRFDLTACQNVGTYNIQVAAFNDKESSILNSELSNTVTYKVTRDVSFHYEYDTGDIKLTTPKVGRDENILYWDIVHYACWYRIYFDGVAHEEVDTNFYEMDRRVIGKYNVTVKAISEDERYGISDASNSIEFDVKEAFNPITVYADDFGAKGNGLQNDRPYIQAAIDHVHNHGGGTVVLTKNKTYLTGGIFMKDNVHLKFEDNAMVKQSPNDQDYVIASKDGTYTKTIPYKGTNINNYVQFNHCWFYNYPLIGCLMETKNISVTGNGVIKMMEYTNESNAIRMVACCFGNSKYIKQEGITVRHYNAYGCGDYCCDYVLVKNITVVDFFGGCNDGIPATNSSNMRITNNYIRSGDDSIDIGNTGEGIRGGVWWQTEPKDVRHLEIDHNDTDASGCKGLAFFAWGGMKRKGISDAESRRMGVIEDVWVHDNKFATMGYWGSASHDNLYGGVGTMPIKDLRFYDNEIGEVLGGFYYEGTTNTNEYSCTSNLMDGDFEYALGAFWSTRGEVDFPTVNNNTYAVVKENSEMFEGIALNEQENYIFSMDIKSFGGPTKIFVRHLDTETVLKEVEVNSSDMQKASLDFIAPSSGNYQIGFKTGAGVTATIDNVTLKKSYSDDLYYDAGSDYHYVAEEGEYGIWLQGYNYISTEADNLKPGDEVKVIYFLTINEIADLNGTISFSPLLQSLETGTIGQSTFTTKNSDLKVKEGKVMLSYKIKLPKSYQTGHSISTRLLAYSGIDFTFHRIIIVKSSLPLSTFKLYETALDAKVDSGSFADIPDGIYLMNNYNLEFSCGVGKYSNWFEGVHVSDDDSIKAGDRIKVTYCFNITELNDPDGILHFDMKTWIDQITEAKSEITLSLSSVGMKTGKVCFSFVGKIYDTRKIDEWIYPMLYFYSGVSGTWDKIIISNENTDISEYTAGYDNLFNKDLIGGIFSTVDGVYLNEAKNNTWTSEKGQQSGWKEFVHASDDAALVEGKLIKITYMFDISEIVDTNSTITMVCQTWLNQITPLYTSNDLSYSEIGLKTGKIAISYIAKINDNHKIDDWIYPMFKFNSGVSGTWERVLITDEDADLSKVYSEYELLVTHYLTGGPFGTDR